jgi:serine/threonine-protein kinase
MQSLIGQALGPYQLVEEVGRGGMAIVYKAYQPALDRMVALKVLPPYFQHDPIFRDRFRREARAAKGLDHPNIVHIFDTGEFDGYQFIAMEYVLGEPLSKRLERERGPVFPDFALAIVEQIASALDYAHAHGVIHRDVKPSNVLVSPDLRAVLTDFGIARAAENVAVTRTGMVVGTPEYMSPEHAEGKPIDGRADLYALGVVTYQMLTGRVPFTGLTPAVVMHQIIFNPPPSPSKYNPALTHPVEQVLVRSLAKDPATRFQTGADMAEALRTALGIQRRPAPAARASAPPLVVPANVPNAAVVTPPPTPLPAPLQQPQIEMYGGCQPAVALAPARVAESAPAPDTALGAVSFPWVTLGCLMLVALGMLIAALIVFGGPAWNQFQGMAPALPPTPMILTTPTRVPVQ